MKINVFQTADELAAGAAADAQKFLRAAVAVKGRAAVILATGNSQILFLEKFVAATGIDWSLVTFFHMDEYLGIPADHLASFRHYLKERVEDKIHPRAFHYLKGDALEPISECLRYEALLSTTGIDLVCMGIGENGHIAFNDPPVANFKDEEGVKLVKLDESCRKQQVGEGHFPVDRGHAAVRDDADRPAAFESRPHSMRRAGEAKSGCGESDRLWADQHRMPRIHPAHPETRDALY